MDRRFFKFLMAGMLALATTGAAHAAEDVVLTVNNLANGTSVTFSQEELDALPTVSFTTDTIWSESNDQYEGPSLSAILEAADMPAGDLRVYAINDYSVAFPAENIEDDAPIIANKINGARFSLRQKGPLWIMFPFDADDKYMTENYFALSVWQLKQIDVLAN